MTDNIIPYSLEEAERERRIKKGLCSFCFAPLKKGESVATEDGPGICFSCVKRCHDLISDGEELSEDYDLHWEDV